MNEYTKMITEARKNGLSTEQALWHSINAVERLLDQMECLKWQFLALQQEALDEISDNGRKDFDKDVGV